MVSMLRGDQDWAVFKLRGQILMEMKKFKEAEEQFESLILQMNNEGTLNIYLIRMKKYPKNFVYFKPENRCSNQPLWKITLLFNNKLPSVRIKLYASFFFCTSLPTLCIFSR